MACVGRAELSNFCDRCKKGDAIHSNITVPNYMFQLIFTIASLYNFLITNWLRIFLMIC